MNMLTPYRSRLLFTGLTCLSLCLAVTSVRANVYATNLRLNDNLTNAVAPAGSSVTIGYTLNEPASLGVTIQIFAGSTVVRTYSVSAPGPGTQLGSNSIVWDGLDDSSNAVPLGSYSVSITARSAGYTNWTQITDDLNNYLFDGRGIAVDRNTNSPYYGRVFAANSFLGPSPATSYGDNVGVLAFNADGSIADTNISIADEYTWSDNDLSPWKVKVSDDDYVYASEAINGGLVYRWDPTLSKNSFLPVLRSDNRPGSASLSGPYVVGSGTNFQVWMCDTNPGSPASLGVLRWLAGTNGACATNDHGQAVVGIGGSLAVAPFDVALDPTGNIYVCQYTSTPGDPVQRVFRFPAATNVPLPEVTATWAVGSGDDSYGEASGIAIDPTGTYVAVAFQGAAPLGTITNGNTKILYATNGALAASIDLGVEMQGIPVHQDTDCAWDAVGNLYYIDAWFSCWRVVSPPGANQSTTRAVATVQFVPPSPPVITGVTVSNAVVTLNFTATTADTPSSFALQSAGQPSGTFTNAANATITGAGSGLFQATVPATAPVEFYRLKRQ